VLAKHKVVGSKPITRSRIFDAFGRERDFWNCTGSTRSVRPNLLGISLEQLLQMDFFEGGPLEQNPLLAAHQAPQSRATQKSGKSPLRSSLRKPLALTRISLWCLTIR
jgi:hypothetical protein